MEELHRLHKDVPFGWLLFLQELFGERARKSSARGMQASRRQVHGAAYVADDLHCLSGPH